MGFHDLRASSYERVMSASSDPTASAPAAPRVHNLDAASIHEFVRDLVGDDLHAKRVLSLANGVVGVLHAATLAIHTIGEALAATANLNPKHAIKQVDRLLSNRGVDVEALAPSWVEFVLGDRAEAVVALDWTDFDADDQTTYAVANPHHDAPSPRIDGSSAA